AAGAAAERRRPEQRPRGRLEQALDHERLERAHRRGRVARDRGAGGGRHGAQGVDLHQRISSSACSAPAAWIAWRMAIRSRGVTPSAFRPWTSSSTVTGPPTRPSRPDSSTAVTSVFEKGTVSPAPKGFGCETSVVVAIVTDRLPWETAT